MDRPSIFTFPLIDCLSIPLSVCLCVFLVFFLTNGIGFFFTRLRINFLLGWHYDFQKILGWLLVGYFKNEKILGCGILGCCNFKKNTRLEILGWTFKKKYSVGVYSVFRLISKNTRLSFSRF